MNFRTSYLTTVFHPPAENFRSVLIPVLIPFSKERSLAVARQLISNASLMRKGLQNSSLSCLISGSQDLSEKSAVRSDCLKNSPAVMPDSPYFPENVLTGEEYDRSYPSGIYLSDNAVRQYPLIGMSEPRQAAIRPEPISHATSPVITMPFRQIRASAETLPPPNDGPRPPCAPATPFHTAQEVAETTPFLK